MEMDQALQDIQYVRSIIERFEHTKERPSSTLNARIQLILQSGALAGSLTVVISEIFDNHLPTRLLLEAGSDRLFQLVSLFCMTIVIALLIGGLYMVLWYGARQEKESLAEYIARNFRRFARLSFASDLLVKYITIAILVIAPAPQWIAALLLVFIADYLFQGRFFLYSVRISLVFGIVCAFAAAAHVALSIHSILPATILFSILSLGSLIIASLQLRALLRSNEGEDA